MAWDSGADAGANWKRDSKQWNDNDKGANGFTDQFANHDGIGNGQGTGDYDGTHGGEAGGDGGGCRNCGQDGHFARDCPEPRKMGACFNCGEEGHSKIDCPNPRVFKGECRSCGQTGHPASDCPTRVVVCKNCRQEGHEALSCKNSKIIDRTNVADKTENEAYAMLQKASDERDITDFKEGVEILSKACPDLTYPQLEKEFRKRGFSIYMIALIKDHGDTFTNVDLQGNIEKKYTIGYYFSDKPQRPNMKAKWPRSSEENLDRLADAGVALDRGVDKCGNCEQLGHTSRKCPEERVANDSRPVIKCALCDEEGHRVRDCTQERKKSGPRACKVCESEEHLAKDCPNREKRTCRNCGSEDHVAKECDQPRNPATIQCRNCDQFGHVSRDCTEKRNYDRVTCSNCQEKGHTKVRCKQPIKDEGGTNGEDVGFADGGAGSATISKEEGNDKGHNGDISAHHDWENTKPVATSGGAAW